MKRITGIGGIFLKANYAKALAARYYKHLVFSFGENLYVNFKWIDKNNPELQGNTVFSFFKKEDNCFDSNQVDEKL